MKISPIEIRKKDFEKAFRGYEKEEVDAFLQSLSQEWEKVLEENREHQKKIEALEKEVARMRDVEATLYKTLKTAEDTSSNIIEQSNKAAELHVREAQMNAEALLNEARGKARAMIEDAELEVKNILDDLQIDAKNIEREYNYIDTQKEYLLDEIKNYVKDTLDKVQKHEQKTNRLAFEQKLKEIRNINNHNPIKQLEITNTEVLKSAESITPVVPKLEEEKKEEKKTDGSFFDSIV
ncbi:MAG TPA: DivIVA domain-containing protein [Cytophagaceae bacterium]|jgi:cell division initiation protein|nr:DivIVA domain-containing protein [Cytophagaceae bacterium]